MLTSIRGFRAVLVLSLGLAMPAVARADETDPPKALTVSGSAAVVSDYRFRGLSLSAGDPTIQGSVTVTHASGFYAGVWGSGLEDSPVYGHTELDFTAGWSGEIGSGIVADAGLTYYVYPNGHVGKANMVEPYASLRTTLGPATAKLGVAYAPSQASLGHEDNLYVYTNLDLGVPTTPVTLSGHLGYTDGALSPNRLTLKDTKGGWDWSLGASASVMKNLSLGVTYVGVGGTRIKDFSDDTVVATLTLSF